MKKLVIRKAVVRDLNPSELSRVQGGMQTTAITCGTGTGCIIYMSLRGCVPSLRNC